MSPVNSKNHRQRWLGAAVVSGKDIFPIWFPEFVGALFENQDIDDLFMDRIPMKRHAEPDEMAGAVLYLASGTATYITGICITCDGGTLV